MLPQTRNSQEILADQSGYIKGITATDIGYAAMHLGAGRQTKEDQLDYAAGIHLNKLVGDKVESGDVLCVLHFNDKDPASAAKLAKKAFIIGEAPPAHESYILDVIVE